MTFQRFKTLSSCTQVQRHFTKASFPFLNTTLFHSLKSVNSGKDFDAEVAEVNSFTLAMVILLYDRKLGIYITTFNKDK